MLSWCFHHLLMDGWCMGILLRELFVLYETLDGGSSERLPDPIPLSDYVRWRSSYDDLSARQYWDSLLDGFKPLTGIAKKEQTQAVVDPVTIDLTLDVELSKKLQMVASARSVTLPILIQSLWAILLSSENSFCRDVVYGIVTSGRPADLDGIDRTVGLFIQTIPLRVSWSEDNSFENLLRDVKEQSLDQMQHGYLPLAEIGRDLFDHLIVFENYPFGNLFRDGELELVDVNGFEKIPYPLGISVIPGDAIQFRFLYDPARMGHEYVLGLSDKLHGLLQAVPVDNGISCLELEKKVSQKEKKIGRASCRERGCLYV